MEAWMVYGIALAIGFLCLGANFLWSRRIVARLKAKIAAAYGKPPVWNLDERDYNSMKHYHQHMPHAGGIDDITWNDLSMDAFFRRFKNTQSSIGDEYCYAFMHRRQNEDLPRFEKAVQAMHSLPEAERLRLQYALYRVGRHTGNGLIDLIADPAGFPRQGLVGITLATLLGVASIGSFFLADYIGVLAVTLSFCVSIILYGVVIRKIGVCFRSLGMLTRMVKAAKLVVKLDIPELAAETAALKPALHGLRHINDLAGFLVQASLAQGSVGGFFMIIVAYFGLYGYGYRALVYFFRRHTTEALVLYETLGRIELYISTASYRASVDRWCTPTEAEGNRVEFENLVHPLLRKPVPNSHYIGNRLIVTGSNASGKSTFAKTLALNAITGQLLHTCLADRYAFRFGQVYTSMNLQDDIEAGDSFYVAEVKSVKRLMGVTAGPQYSMLFIDELFKGTNMVERIAAATAILERLAAEDCFVCLATHDMELAAILGERYEYYHFQEEIEGEEIRFDYRLRDGVTTGSNAIKLLAYCKYDEALVANAQRYADAYRRQGEWTRLEP